MAKKKTQLIKISTYAKREGISVPAAYKRIDTGKATCVEIDGVKFIEEPVPDEAN